MKATPGPWEVGGSTGNINQIRIDRRCGPMGPLDPIGCCYGKGAEAEANAHLIAASPTMYVALEGIIARANDKDEYKIRDIKALATQALAIARGEK